MTTINTTTTPTSLKVYVDPIPDNLSRAMFRVGRALRKWAPEDKGLVEVCDNVEEADLQVLHVIGVGAEEKHLKAKGKDGEPGCYAVIQYCLGSAGGAGLYRSLWANAEMVWSYYNLADDIADIDTPFYLAPLGVDECFINHVNKEALPDIGIMTSGYVDGPGAEAISVVAIAAEKVGMSCVHLNHNCLPEPLRSNPPKGWSCINGITDDQLATLYTRSLWVSGLRHVEGFELPCIEGLMCGARPIVFDRPDMRRWYNGYASFIPETNDQDELVESIVEVLSKPPRPVGRNELYGLRQRFSWELIAKGFWEVLLEGMREKEVVS